MGHTILTLAVIAAGAQVCAALAGGRLAQAAKLAARRGTYKVGRRGGYFTRVMGRGQSSR